MSPSCFASTRQRRSLEGVDRHAGARSCARRSGSRSRARRGFRPRRPAARRCASARRRCCVGLITGSGPPSARLSVRRAASAQNELNGPISATSERVVRVGVGVGGAAARVEVAGLRRRLVARLVADVEAPGAVAVLLEHEPDRVDVGARRGAEVLALQRQVGGDQHIRRRGRPSRSGCTPAPAASRSRVPPSVLAQATPSPAASDWTAPTGTRAVTRFVRGSTRDTVPVTKLPTQTAPAP